MKWCCSTFKGWFEDAGNRGLAVVVEQSTFGPAFFIQFRAVDMDDEGPKDHPRPFTLATQSGILFCPWCGVDLAAFYKRHVQEMERPAYRLEH
jgi:hypothetical protein